MFLTSIFLVGSKKNTYAINSYRSELSELKWFDVVESNLIPDIMHDCLEGVLQYEAKLMLRQFITQDHYFSLAQLNQQIESFEYGYTGLPSHPTPITQVTLSDPDGLLKQSGKCPDVCVCDVTVIIVCHYAASQMWLLGRLLPVMVGRFIPESDACWQNYVLLLDIVDILMAPEVVPSDISLLAVLIEDHHREFTTLYPTSSVIPKMHHMVHMPGFIRK